MFKSFLSTSTILLFCGSLSAQQARQASGPRFLDDITVEVSPFKTVAGSVEKPVASYASKSMKKEAEVATADAAIESAEQIQFKYSILMDTEVESVESIELFKLIDKWMGTRYRLGGTTKRGIDCSAFMQVLFTSFYGISIPRTAREQYAACDKIERSELKEGDLVFFNTTGGISHVGMYLQNNKFVHTSSSMGVTISDLDEEYWSRRFVGTGRIADSAALSSAKP